MKQLPIVLLLIALYSCGPAKLIHKNARHTLITHAGIDKAHIGISIFEAASNKQWYTFQGDHYFVPASNVKLFTAYAALKYLGDSIKGLKYEEHENNTIIIEGTGDPSFLHPSFPNQRVLDLLKTKAHILINTENWKAQALGKGWSWDDYNSDYMAERSALPLYANLVRFKKKDDQLFVLPSYFKDSLIDETDGGSPSSFIKRNLLSNSFSKLNARTDFDSVAIPFITNEFYTTRRLLRDTLKKDVRASYYPLKTPRYINSQLLDDVLNPMMHESDNFFAEQVLLMVSNEELGVMNDERIIDSLLKTALSDLPQKPRWIDGSGLSRYNLFTPNDFVAILNKMNKEFGMDRVRKILPTGNEGTLKNYYVADSNHIYAKTGSMSGVVAISGYLYTRKNKLLSFSILVNNNTVSATEVRRAIESFLTNLRNRF
jgi:serine-type D-Ala-D-Ala carboxypeptidase/endopeptidase (penicillin-binding protein 4)